MFLLNGLVSLINLHLLQAQQPKMVIFWGEPNIGFNCSTKIATNTISSCISGCVTNDNCIVAYQQDSTTCFNCKWFEVLSITILNPGTTKIAVKMNLTTCPLEDVGIFAIGQALRVVSYTDQYIYTYTIGVLANVMFLNALKTSICGPEGYLVNRTTGYRCLHTAYYTILSPLSVYVGFCQAQGEMITALESPAEVSAVVDGFYGMVGKLAINVRIDGTKISQCVGSTAPACQGINAYTFTDPTLKNLEGMVFLEDLTGFDPGVCPTVDCLQMLYLGTNDARSGMIMPVCCITSSAFSLTRFPVWQGYICSFDPKI